LVPRARVASVLVGVVFRLAAVGYPRPPNVTDDGVSDQTTPTSTTKGDPGAPTNKKARGGRAPSSSSEPGERTKTTRRREEGAAAARRRQRARRRRRKRRRTERGLTSRWRSRPFVSPPPVAGFAPVGRAELNATAGTLPSPLPTALQSAAAIHCRLVDHRGRSTTKLVGPCPLYGRNRWSGHGVICTALNPGVTAVHSGRVEGDRGGLLDHRPGGSRHRRSGGADGPSHRVGAAPCPR